MVETCDELIPWLHYTDITSDAMCLVYALMVGTGHNIGAIVKSVMRKDQVHKGTMYDFDGLITQRCHSAGVREENIDYIAPLYVTPVNITHTKGPKTKFGPTLTIAEHHKREELIMEIMYDLEMMRH